MVQEEPGEIQGFERWQGLPAPDLPGLRHVIPIKSNLGVHEELQRMQAVAEVALVEPSCPDEDCDHHGLGVSVGKPFYSSSGSTKAISHLTDFGDYDLDHLAWLYNKASLHAVDTMFMQIRRRVMMLERSIHSQGNRGRVWHG